MRNRSRFYSVCATAHAGSGYFQPVMFDRLKDAVSAFRSAPDRAKLYRITQEGCLSGGRPASHDARLLASR